MKELIFDIETVPDEKLIDELKPEASMGNLKDPVKIKAKKEEWEQDGQVKKMAVSPFMNQIVSIQAWSSIENDFIDFNGEANEESKIKLITDAIDQHDITVGHNIIGFDLPTVVARSMFLDMLPSKTICNIKRYSSHPFYDTMQQLAGWDRDKWKGLDWWCKRLGLKGKSNHGSNVYQLWTEGKQSEIDEYCKDDVRATKELYDRIKLYY